MARVKFVEYEEAQGKVKDKRSFRLSNSKKRQCYKYEKSIIE